MEELGISSAEQIRNYHYEGFDKFIQSGLEAKKQNNIKDFYKVIFGTGYTKPQKLIDLENGPVRQEFGL